ncbi:7TM-DISM domain-containing protein, partial [Arsenicibacter rosenii]|uniref:7TM-DISM domain-containing protein n=1 Tax=Arsenicibacter rosenii TaxID=1750698 RepID=UPI001160CFDE
MKPFLLIICLYSILASAHAQPIVLTNPERGYPIAERCDMLDAQAGDIPIDSLLSHPSRYRFVAINKQTARAATDQERWFRFTVQTSLQTAFYLYAESDLSSPATLYQTYGNRIQDRFLFVKGQNNTSINVPQARSRRLMPLRLNPGNTYTFYWHSTEIPEMVKLVSGERLLTVFLRQDSFDGFYYGFVLIIIVYNILLYIRLKDRDHLIYAIWMGIQCLVYSITFAHLRNWLPPAYYSFFLKHFLAVTFLAAAFHILFGVTFLQLRQHARSLYQAGLVLFYVCVLLSFMVVGAGLFGIYLPYNSAFLTGFIDLVFTLICGVAALRKGFKPAWYYVLGLLLIYGGTIVYVFTSLRLMPSTFWTTNGLLLGSTLEILLFTLALAYKVNLLKQQKEDAIQDQLRLLEQNQTLIET